MIPQDLISIIISSIAIILSVFTLWYRFLSPFKPQFNLGAPMLSLDEFSKDKDRVTFTLDFLFPVSIANSGTKGGTIKEIVIIVTAGDLKWILVPLNFAQEFGLSAFSEGKREIYHPLYINAKEEIYKNIIFKLIPMREKFLAPFVTEVVEEIEMATEAGDIRRVQVLKEQKGSIPSGIYKFQFYISWGSSTKLKHLKTRKMNLKEDDVKLILSHNVIKKLYEETLSGRKRLLDKMVDKVSAEEQKQ